MLFLSSLLAKIQLLLKIPGLCDFPLSCGRTSLPAQISGQPGRALKTCYAVLPLLSSLWHSERCCTTPSFLHCHRQALPATHRCLNQAEQFSFAIPNASVNNTDKKWPVQPEGLVSGSPRSTVHVRNISPAIKWPLHAGHPYFLWRCKPYQPHRIHICIFLLWHCGYHSLICCDFRLFTQLMAQDSSLINLNGCWHAKHCIVRFIEDPSKAYPCKAFQNPICFSHSAVSLFLGISLWWTVETDVWLSLQFLVRFTLNFVH